MRRKWNGKLLIAVLSLAAFVLLGAITVWADHFKPLSPNHTSYGVAQLNYGNIPKIVDDVRPAVKLMNPNHISQAVAGLIYSSDRGRDGAGQATEVFLGCKVDVLTPHDSTDISQAELVAAGVPENRPLYAEYIWAPLGKVSLRKDDDDEDHEKGDRKKRRIADGLGGSAVSASFEAEGEARLAHPGLFSLPSNSVIPGQREAAVRCICAELVAQGLDPKVFSEFGVSCP